MDGKQWSLNTLLQATQLRSCDIHRAVEIEIDMSKYLNEQKKNHLRTQQDYNRNDINIAWCVTFSVCNNLFFYLFHEYTVHFDDIIQIIFLFKQKHITKSTNVCQNSCVFIFNKYVVCLSTYCIIKISFWNYLFKSVYTTPKYTHQKNKTTLMKLYNFL